MIRPLSCPICDKPVTAPVEVTSGTFFPFCSERCRQVDLFRWCEGKYAIVEPLAADDTAGDGQTRDEPDGP